VLGGQHLTGWHTEWRSFPSSGSERRQCGCVDARSLWRRTLGSGCSSAKKRCGHCERRLFCEVSASVTHLRHCFTLSVCIYTAHFKLCMLQSCVMFEVSLFRLYLICDITALCASRTRSACLRSFDRMQCIIKFFGVCHCMFNSRPMLLGIDRSIARLYFKLYLDIYRRRFLHCKASEVRAKRTVHLLVATVQ